MAGTGGLLHASLQVAQAQFLPFGKTGNTPISPIANSQTVFSTVRILHSTYLESPSVEGLSANCPGMNATCATETDASVFAKPWPQSDEYARA